MKNALLLSGGAIAGIIIGVIFLLLIIVAIAIIAWWIKTRNAFVRLKNLIEEAWANIDVFLKKRFDLIPNLVETVKGYAKHETEFAKTCKKKGVNCRFSIVDCIGKEEVEACKILANSVGVPLYVRDYITDS